MVKRMNKKSKQPEKLSLEPEDAFAVVGHRLANALLQGQEHRNRYMLLASASGVIYGLLRSMQVPRDQRLIARLATLNLQITGFLDHIVANADASDQGLQALCRLAELEPAWPTLARPGDPKFTELKLERLKVGSKCAGSLPRNAKQPPTFATDSNRLVGRLVRRIQNHARIVVASDQEALNSLRFIAPNVPEKERAQYLEILRKAKGCPLTVKTITQWNRILPRYILMIDPDLKRTAELRSLRENEFIEFANCSRGDLISKLQKFFHPALKHIAKAA
jgi:hypothetical protein